MFHSFLKFFKIYLFYLILAALALLCCARGFTLVSESGGYSSLRCVGLLRWLLLLWSTGSRRAGFSSCGSQALECRLSSCGAWAQLLRGMWDLPGPGLEPVSPALAGGFLTAAPPGKPPNVSFFCPFFIRVSFSSHEFSYQKKKASRSQWNTVQS